MKLLKAEAGVNDGKAGLLSAAGLFAKGGIFDKKSESFNIQELDPYLLFDARSSMLGTLENPTLDLDPATPSTLDVITATRASVATRTLSDGSIALAEQDTVRVDYTQGAELTPAVYQNIEYTDFSQDWTIENSTLTESQTTAPDGTTPVYELTENTSTSRHRLYRGFPNIMTLVVGQDYTVSAYVKKVSSGRFFLINSSPLNGIKGFLNLDTGVATLTSGTGTITVTDEGGGWYRLSVTAQATSTNGFVYMQLQDAQTDVNYTGTGASMLIYGPQLEEGTTATTFVENTTGSPKFITGATYGPRVPMILVEPSATNLVTYSEDFSQSSWDKQSGGTGVAPAITSDDTTAPDGTQSADKVVFNKGASADPANYSILSDAFPSQQNTASLFIKADSPQRIVIRNSSNWVAYDVTTEWTRIEQTDNGGSLQIGLRDGYGIPNVPDTATVYLWGAQAEAGSVATSYIPTSGGDAAARTRAADDLVISGSDFSDFYNGSEGTFYIEAIDREVSGGDHAYIVGQGTSQFFLYKNNAVTSVNNFDGVNLLDITGLVSNQLFRAAASYNSSVKSLSFNGTTVSGNARASGGFDVANVLKIGSGYTNVFSGHYRRIIYWPYHSDSL